MRFSSTTYGSRKPKRWDTTEFTSGHVASGNSITGHLNKVVRTHGLNLDLQFLGIRFGQGIRYWTKSSSEGAICAPYDSACYFACYSTLRFGPNKWPRRVRKGRSSCSMLLVYWPESGVT